MKLVEVISGFETAPETVEIALRLCRAVGKTPISVKDVPGFAVNRLLHVLMIEAVRLVEENVASPEDIDIACRLGLGHPMGPFELMDVTTSSLCLQAQEIMHEAYGERFRPRPLLKQRVGAGMVGGGETRAGAVKVRREVDMSLFDLSGKVSIVTGSSRGIGRAIAERMAEAGAKVVISSRKQEACDAVAAGINDRYGDEKRSPLPPVFHPKISCRPSSSRLSVNLDAWILWSAMPPPTFISDR